MQIIWITQTDFDENLDIATWKEMSEALEKLGPRVNLILPAFKRGKSILLKDVSVTCLPYPRIRFLSSLIYQLSLFFYVGFILIFKRPDVIITDHFCVYTMFLFNLFSKMRIVKSKFILDIRSIPIYAVEEENINYKIQDMRFYTGMIIAKYLYDGITAITPMYREKISKDFKIDPKKIGIWTSGVSMELFNSKNGKNMRKLKGLDNRFIIMYHGSMVASRGLEELCIAVDKSKNEIPELCLFLLGGGSGIGELKQFVKNRRLNDKIIIHEPVEYCDVPAYIAMCDVGILQLPDILLWRMSSPLKLMEYLAMGKPVILTRIPAHEFIVGNSRCGIFIDSHLEKDVQKGIRYVYNMRSELKLIGEEGKDIIEKRFTWDQQAIKLYDYIKKVINC